MSSSSLSSLRRCSSTHSSSHLSTPPGREAVLRHIAPPFFTQPGIEKIDSPVMLPEDSTFPNPMFTGRHQDAQKRRVPQCIAHRGYRSAYPENTMAAFAGAVKAGAQALEMDIHLTRDDVVVISHDASLKRCFGRREKIIDCTWAEIEPLRTIAKPHEPMPRLSDVLGYLAQPGLEEIWILLDIKLDNDTEKVMRLLAKAIAAAPPAASRAWRERIVLGVWAAKHLPYAAQYLPEFPVTHIGFSLGYARHFFDVPNVSFNMAFPLLVAPGGRRFLRDAREKHHRQVYAWTVNAEDRMEWCIRQRLDGVITDNPALYLKVRDRFDEHKAVPKLSLTFKSYCDVYRIWIWVTFAALIFWSRFTPVASRSLIQKGPARR